jgi:bifunctional non-homologous end joining protein LigD
MLATLADPPATGPGLIYEPKYDGIRALIHVAPPSAKRHPRPVTRDRRPATSDLRPAAEIKIWSRRGNDKTTQFPSIVRALEPLARALKAPLLIDGEIVALDERGNPAGFQRLQGRIHLKGERDVEQIERTQPVALIAFDLLRDGDDDLRGLALSDRRRRLEARLDGQLSPTLRISEQAAADGRALLERAQKEGWEGLIVKEARSPYVSGRRSPTWRKKKVVHNQEFVIGGWTDPRQTRTHFGALLLGVHAEGDQGKLKYVGHTGTGFDHQELERVWKLLEARETAASPFTEKIKTNEPAHWVKPNLVAQVRFTEWTDDEKLRHPVYLGLRDDKPAAAVVREVPSVSRASARGPSEAPACQPKRGSASAKATADTLRPERARRLEGSRAERGRRARARESLQPPRARMRERTAPGVGPRRPERRWAPRAVRNADERAANNPVVDQLRALEDGRKDGVLELPGGQRLGVTNLAKLFWPKLKLTKGDLLRYYADVAPLILPAVADRPLVMKRFPNGVGGAAFYQQRSRLEKPPPGVRIETLADDLDPISEADARRFVGGDLITLLYMTQLAAISQDPWFSRVQSPLDADYVALDLDPGEGTTFARVLDVARWVRDELASLKVPAVPKTSGSRGLHVYIPLPPGTSYQSGQLFCQIVATVIAARHPKAATVERTVRARPKGTVYVDYLQNILGKTLATAYSARASEFAGVSTPLRWAELDEPFAPQDFTIVTAPRRFRETGDLWARLRTSKPANLAAVFRKYAREQR